MADRLYDREYEERVLLRLMAALFSAAVDPETGIVEVKANEVSDALLLLLALVCESSLEAGDAEGLMKMSQNFAGIFYDNVQQFQESGGFAAMLTDADVDLFLKEVETVHESKGTIQ